MCLIIKCVSGLVCSHFNHAHNNILILFLQFHEHGLWSGGKLSRERWMASNEHANVLLYFKGAVCNAKKPTCSYVLMTCAEGETIVPCVLFWDAAVTLHHNPSLIGKMCSSALAFFKRVVWRGRFGHYSSIASHYVSYDRQAMRIKRVFRRLNTLPCTHASF